MATYMDINKVKLLCNCKKSHPISREYFCKHCQELRCSNCVSHEVDSHYCPFCLENMPSAEAKMRKNRCANCFDCPSCGHSLSTRATMALLANPADPTQSVNQKMYYMACGYCRWTTRDAGIRDQKAASGGWPDTESEHLKRISSLIESFRQLAIKEKIEKERKKYARKRNFSAYDRYGLSFAAGKPRGSMSRGRSLFRDNSETASFDEDDTQADGDGAAIAIVAAEASEDVEPLDEDLYLKEPFVVDKVTTITQRLMNPDLQPSETAGLAPRHKQLLVKRSMRCRQCEHNLSKPEYQASSIKFKINMAAAYHVPEIRIQEVPTDLAFGKKSKMVLTVLNPAHRMTTIRFSPVSGEADTFSTAKLDLPEEGLEFQIAAYCQLQEMDEAVIPYMEDIHSGPLTRLDYTILNVMGHFIFRKLNTPEGEVKLAQRDDSTEYDESALDAGHDFKDDPKVIAFRRANKVGLLVPITPMKSSGDVRAAFSLTFDYQIPVLVTATSPQQAAENKSPGPVQITVRVFLDLGRIQGDGGGGGHPVGMTDDDE